MAIDIAKYKDPRWQKKRLEIFERDDWSCQICFSQDETLNVHHLYYSKKLEPWEYDNRNLITLCEACHQKEPILKDISKRLLFSILESQYTSKDLMQLVKGLGNLKLDNLPTSILVQGIAHSMTDKDTLSQTMTSFYEYIKGIDKSTLSDDD